MNNLPQNLKHMEQVNTGYTNHSWGPCNSLDDFGKETGELEIGWSIRPSRILRCWDRLEYSGEFWIAYETCCHLDSRENSSVNGGVKKS